MTVLFKALHSELLTELSGRFPSRNKYFVHNFRSSSWTSFFRNFRKVWNFQISQECNFCYILLFSSSLGEGERLYGWVLFSRNSVHTLSYLVYSLWSGLRMPIESKRKRRFFWKREKLCFYTLYLLSKSQKKFECYEQLWKFKISY